MTFLQAVILGIVEGLTEFLPVSSTGHLILAAHVLRVQPSEFLKSFEIFIQLGGILAVVVLYFRYLLRQPAVWGRVAVAFVPTMALGLVLYKIVKTFLLGNLVVVVAALFAGGILLIAFELLHREKPDAVEGSENIPLKTAFWIGVFQALAMIPGVSRSGATILGGLLLGLKRKTIVEFSFLLAIPTMAAATGLDILKSGFSFSGWEWLLLLTGFTVSFAVAVGAIRFLLSYIQNNNFIPFGIYRIAAALLFWAFVIR